MHTIKSARNAYGIYSMRESVIGIRVHVVPVPVTTTVLVLVLVLVLVPTMQLRALCGTKVYIWIPTVYQDSELRFPILT